MDAEALETADTKIGLPRPARAPRLSRLAAAARSVADAIRALTTFEMPQHLALTTRGAVAPVGAGYSKAMAEYRAGRYATARRGLVGALEAGEGKKVPEIHFFLAACLV